MPRGTSATPKGGLATRIIIGVGTGGFIDTGHSYGCDVGCMSYRGTDEVVVDNGMTESIDSESILQKLGETVGDQEPNVVRITVYIGTLVRWVVFADPRLETK
jgi:hypothetical protein